MARWMPLLRRAFPPGSRVLSIRFLAVLCVVVSLGQTTIGSEDDAVVWDTSAIGPASVSSSSLSCYTALTACPVFQISAAGSPSAQDDVYGFISRPLIGDGVVIARIRDLKGVASSSAGLMIRGSLEPAAAQLMVLQSSGGAVTVRSRDQAQGRVTESQVSAQSGAAWMRLERQGQTITVSQSADGTQWTQSWSGTVDLPAAASVGITVTSQRSDALATAVMSDVRVDERADLPPWWAAARIGSPSIPGHYQYLDGVWTISNWGTGSAGADEALFAYQRVSGDTEIVARLLGAAGGSTTMGLMVRESLEQQPLLLDQIRT